MCVPKKRQKMMFTNRLHWNIFNYHHIFIAFIEGYLKLFIKVNTNSGENFRIHFCHSFRCIYKPLSISIFSNSF